MLCGGYEVREIVPYDAFEDYLDSELVQLFGEVQRVGVGAEGSEQLRANRNDFRVHG